MNNIPQFLEHLPIWKANPLDQVKATKQIKKAKPVKTHQFDVTDRMSNHVVEKVCPICGAAYTVAYRLRNIKKHAVSLAVRKCDYLEKNLRLGLMKP